MKKKPTPNAERSEPDGHRIPHIEWLGVREDEGRYGADFKTHTVQRSTFNVQRQKGAHFDLEERLLKFSAAVIELVDALPNTRAGNHIGGQLLRCGTSPYGTHGEVQAAESRRDFVHKLRICLKELKETRRWLRLIQRAAPLPEAKVAQLIKIFFTSIRTAKKNAE